MLPGECRRTVAKRQELAALLVGGDEQRRGGSVVELGPSPRRRWNASVSSRSCAGDSTFDSRNSVIPAAGASRQSARHQSAAVASPVEGEHQPPEDGLPLGARHLSP